jgi:hypothetical protein
VPGAAGSNGNVRDTVGQNAFLPGAATNQTAGTQTANGAAGSLNAGTQTANGAAGRLKAGNSAATSQTAGTQAGNGAAGRTRPSYGGRPAYSNVFTRYSDNRDIEANIEKDEYFIAALLSIDNSLWDIVAEKLPHEYINNQNIRQSVIYMCEQIPRGVAVSPGELMRFFTPDENDRLAGLIAKGCHCEDNRRAMEQKIIDFHESRKQKQMNELKRIINSDSTPEQEKKQYEMLYNKYYKMDPALIPATITTPRKTPDM